MIKTIPKKKKCKQTKWLSEEGLQIAEKRREMKNKGEKERYTHLNAEFQRIARKDKKAFLSGQCKEIEKNNRMGKTRDLCKKIRLKIYWAWPQPSYQDPVSLTVSFSHQEASISLLCLSLRGQRE